MSITAYPLAWPDGWPRTLAGEREDSRYKSQIARAIRCGDFEPYIHRDDEVPL